MSTPALPAHHPRTFLDFMKLTSFIRSVADLLRGDYEHADHGKVIRPFTVLSRSARVLDRAKAQVLSSIERADRLRTVADKGRSVECR